MPSYELALLLRKVAKPEAAVVLKRTAHNLWKHQGVLFGIESLGTRRLPFFMRAFGKRHVEGSYFIMQLDAPAKSLNLLTDEFERDVDILRAHFVREEPVEKIPCTLEAELQPPAYRDDVKKLIEEGRRPTRKFNLNIDFPYNPFNR